MGQCRQGADREGCAEVTPLARVLVNWKQDRVFDAGKEGRPTIRIDGDGNEGPSPPDTLLAALGACVSVDVVDILAKRRTPVERYHVEMLGERVDTEPRHFSHITLNIFITGAGIERVHAERAIDLAINKYCSVRDSLSPDIPVVWNLSLNEPSTE
jgi:putative redox protein